MENIEKKVETLIEALPFIKKYKGKTVVVKFGGNAMLNDEIKISVLKDIVLMQSLGIRVVVSHGGGPAINELLGRLDIKSEFVNGLRVTSKEVIEVVEMALVGKVCSDLVKKIMSLGGKAVGLSGVSGGIYRAEKLKRDYDYGFVGEVVNVDTSSIETLLDAGFIPVISPLGADLSENTYNINGDTAAGVLAAALKAEKLILLTDIVGLCNDIKTLDVISYLNIKDVDALKEKGVIAGGMIPKIDCCVDAIKDGVKQVHIMDGRVSHSLLFEAFVEELGHGTIVGEDSDSVGIKW